jgi:hypothetical protein
LTQRYQDWLLTEYTERYRRLASEADLAWFESVCIQVVIFRVLEYKYHASQTPTDHASGHASGFVDHWAGAIMAFRMQMQEIPKKVATIASHYHKTKDQAEARELIRLFSEEQTRQIEQRMHLFSDALPELSPGGAPLFPLLPQPPEQNVQSEHGQQQKEDV